MTRIIILKKDNDIVAIHSDNDISYVVVDIDNPLVEYTDIWDNDGLFKRDVSINDVVLELINDESSN